MKISNLRFLENIEEIKKLKYSYFQACDVNNLDQIKRTFATENLNIDFENFGSFTDIGILFGEVKKKIN